MSDENEEMMKALLAKWESKEKASDFLRSKGYKRTGALEKWTRPDPTKMPSDDEVECLVLLSAKCDDEEEVFG